MNLPKPDSVFTGFRIATMDPERGSAAYGAVNDHAIGVVDGRIAWLVAEEELPAFDDTVDVISGSDRLLSPGLIDCHTHLVYGGNRAREWEMRLGGVSYEEIARQGGGILSTVKDTRSWPEELLVFMALRRLKQLMAEGVTTVEIKSGYGLDLETELKMLRAARTVGEKSGVHVETTLLAAHTVPPEFKGRADEYVDLVCYEMIPAAVELCTSVDAFCESIAFNVAQTKRVFKAARKAGLNIKVHAEQLSHTGSAVMAAERGALSADHLEYLTPDDCRALAEHGTVAVLLPGAFYCLKETQQPPVPALIEHGVPIAIGTDCNPGSSPVTSLLLIGNMGCNLFGLTPEQSFAGMTRNAARALGLQEQIGMVREGLQADFAVWDVESPAEILYGIGTNPCEGSYRGGKLMQEKRAGE